MTPITKQHEELIKQLELKGITSPHDIIIYCKDKIKKPSKKRGHSIKWYEVIIKALS